jgi:ABC-type Fe3+-hydroxamate transport system substrate-binding protein
VVQLPTQPVLDFALLKGLQPDALVVDTAQLGSQLVLLRKWATQQQLPLLVQNYQYLEAYAENARQLGTLLDNRTAAEALGNRFLRLVDSVRTRTAAFPRKQVLVLLDIRPQDGYVTAVAGGHVLDKVVRAAGGDNPFSQTPQPLVVVSPEMLLRTQPDAVFLPDGQEENLAALIGLLPQVANWPAVQQSQLFAFAPEQYLATGTSLIATLLEIAQSLHPEASTERAFEQIFK